MAYEEKLITISKQASADLSASQYCFVKLASGQTALPAANGADAFGIQQDKPTAQGQASEVAVGGVSKVQASGTFSSGANLTCDAAGKVKVAATGNTILGKAMADGVAGIITTMLVEGGGVSA